MLPGMELMGCADLAVPAEVMQHVIQVESSSNPYAIGVVGGRLARQPRNMAEALATARMLEEKGYNFSVGLAQVNRHNLARQGLSDYSKAFQVCPNIQAGARILAECFERAQGDWGKAFSCYYSGNFVTGFRHGYVQKVLDSIARAGRALVPAIAVEGVQRPEAMTWTQRAASAASAASSLLARRTQFEAAPVPGLAAASASAPVHAASVAAMPAPGEEQTPSPTGASAPVQVRLVGAPAPAGEVPSGRTAPAVSTTPEAPAPSRAGADEAFVF